MSISLCGRRDVLELASAVLFFYGEGSGERWEFFNPTEKGIKRGEDMRNLVLVALLAVGIGIHADASADGLMGNGKSMGKRMKFAEIYEPSGIVQLADGRVFLIEDEQTNPFSLCHLEERDGQPALGVPQSCTFSGVADDLEGLTHGPNGWLYAITSHSPAGSGKASRERGKLLRFRVSGEGMIEDYQEYGGLLAVLLPVLKALDPTIATINIEGLSSDRDRKKLYIGLREPVVAGASLILSLENPEGLFDRGELPRITQEVIRLHLQGGGIRAMAYVERLDGYLIANEITLDEGKPRACLWLWDGNALHAARRLDFPGSGKLKNIEGISPVQVQGRPLLLLVCDDGKRQEGDGAHYRFVEYDQLIESEPER
ncbi:MAG: DUF3616 domain-containing protein [Desulfoprunum sp.]|nr:DUF3616 domain-containing protein [Desulfoprunum sp.]